MSQTDTVEVSEPSADTNPTTIPAADIIVNHTTNEPTSSRRGRNYSFLHKRADSLDEVEVNGVKFTIPAGSVGSCYWGILKVAYEKHDKPIYPNELIDAVAEIMADRDPAAWDEYCNKPHTTVHKKSAHVSEKKPARPWQERVINNAKTLTRKAKPKLQNGIWIKIYVPQLMNIIKVNTSMC